MMQHLGTKQFFFVCFFSGGGGGGGGVGGQILSILVTLLTGQSIPWTKLLGPLDLDWDWSK